MTQNPSLCAAAVPHEHWSDPGRAGYGGLQESMAAHCHPMRGIHLPGCDTADCRGCMPRLADAGSAVCRACRLRIADRVRELPQVWEDLLTPTRGAASSEVAPDSETSAAVGDEARNARSAIRLALVAWCETLSIERALPKPADNVQAMADRVSRFLDVLLGDPAHAVQLVHDVDLIATEARRRAYPAPPKGRVIGVCPIRNPEHEACGGQVRATLETWDQAGWATCGTCKTSAVLEYWLALMPPEVLDWLGMKALRWHLALHTGRQISEDTIRSWARDPGKLPSRTLGVVPYPAAGRPELAGRVEYRVEEATALCGLARRRGRPRALVSA